MNSNRRDDLCIMNEMFDNIIRDANLPTDGIPEVDVSTSNDITAINEALQAKLDLINKCCDESSASTTKKYDIQTIRDKISAKRQQLAELEAENQSLIETAKRQEQILSRISQNGDESPEAQECIQKLHGQLQNAENEITQLEQRRPGVLAENRRLKGELQVQHNNSDEILQSFENAQQANEAQQEEELARQRRMEEIQLQKDELMKRKKELEYKIKEKQKELELIHSSKGKNISSNKKLVLP